MAKVTLPLGIASISGALGPFMYKTFTKSDGIKETRVSPNPVSSILHIQTPDEHSLTKIYAINGQCVQQSVYADIDVSALPQGMYILRALTADGQLHQAKFIKQ